MSSNESNAGSSNTRKLNRGIEDSSNNVSRINARSRKKYREKYVRESDSSDSDVSPVRIALRRRRIINVCSDSESSSSGSSVGNRPKQVGRILSDSDMNESTSCESDFTDTEQDIDGNRNVNKVDDSNVESDSSDGQSDKCPICLISFKNQEIGVPESCDHHFCLECIQEWSKNVNTCPIDRSEYNVIFARENKNSLIITRNIPIEKPSSPQYDLDIIQEDPTYCEICGSDGNEDRMLLCDACDLGYHLYCLSPPLDDVPSGTWFCSSCSRESTEGRERSRSHAFQAFENDLLERQLNQHRNRNSSRLIPRTRQSEIVRRRIQSSRNQRSNVHASEPEEPSTSRQNRTRNKPKTKRKRKQKRRTVYKIVYVIDEVTGEAVPVKKRCKQRRRKTKRQPKTSQATNSKKRLATQLGLSSKSSNRASSTVSSSCRISSSRQQAGIPNLNLFGSIYDLDYFSDEEDQLPDMFHGSQVLSRAPSSRPSTMMRRAMRQKSSIALTDGVSSSTDLLDSILDSQQKFHSKKTVFTIESSTGELKMGLKKNQNNNYININSSSFSGRQTHGGNSLPNQNQPTNNTYSSGNYSHSPAPGYDHAVSTSTAQQANRGINYGFGNNDDMPQDYTHRTLCEAEQVQDERVLGRTGSNTPASESDLDIYSDIESETVSTSKIEHEVEALRPPPSPSQVLQHIPDYGDDVSDNDSEGNMVIDTDKYHEENKEETAVSSTVEPFVAPMIDLPPPLVSSDIPLPTSSTGEIQSETVQSSSCHVSDENSTVENYSCVNITSNNMLKNNDDDSNDGCPNFSIYSKESKTVALTTDIGILPQPNNLKNNQEAEISSPTMPGSYLHEVLADERYSPSSPLDTSPKQPEESHFEQEESQQETNSITQEESQQETNSITQEELQKSPDNRYSEEKVPEVKASENISSTKSVNSNFRSLYSDSEDESVVKKDNFPVSDVQAMTEDILSEEERSYTPRREENEKVTEGLEGLDTELISDEDRNDFDESQELKTVSDGDALEIDAKESELDLNRPEDYEEGEIVDKNKEKLANSTDVTKEPENTHEKDNEKVRSTKDKKKEKEKEKTERNDKSSNKENVNRDASFKKLSKSNKERNYRDKERERRSKTPALSKGKETRRKKEKRKELERYNVRALIAEKPRPPPKDKFGRDLRRTPTLSRSRSRSYTPPLRRSVSRGRSPKRILTVARRSRSRSRSVSPAKRPHSAERNKSKKKKDRSRRRSRSRSPRPKRSGSKNKKRKRSRSRSERRQKSKDGNKRKKRRSQSRGRSASMARRSAREWTPSFSKSPSPIAHRNVSPSWTPPRESENARSMRNKNLTVMLNSGSQKKKKDKRRRSEKKKDDSQKRRKERERTPPPSKEVFASGDNILVSVSFNNENETRDISTRDKRRKETDESRKKRDRKRQSLNSSKKDLSGVKPVAIIDLDRSPFQEIPASPKDIIVLSDSDSNENANTVQTGVCDSSQQVASPEEVGYISGPKTPPEPQVKFSLPTKSSQLRAISNPLHEPENIEKNDDIQELANNTYKGPNTPPEPPSSPPSSPDAYDPFEPTKSRSPTPERETLQTTMGSDNRDDSHEIRSSDLLEKPTQTPDATKSLTPPSADVQPADSQSSINATPEKSPEQRIGVVINQVLQPSTSATTIFSSVPSLVTSTPVPSSLSASRINILNSTVINPPNNSISQRMIVPNQGKMTPAKVPPIKTVTKSSPMKAKSKIKKTLSNNNIEDNIDLESPYSPGSSDYDDLFDPPLETPVKSTSKKSSKSGQKHQSTFDVLFGSPVYNKKKSNDVHKYKKNLSPLKIKHVGVKIDEDSLRILDEVPSSAVEMQIKDKFLKKLNRQERVVEEVKLVLKPYYNKKKVTKEEYKDIMRKAVPKICHNKSGEINPSKIKNLVEAYVRKLKHSKKVTSSSSVPQKL